MQNYRYPDNTVARARPVNTGKYLYPAGYLAQRAAEPVAAWIARLAAIGVAPVRYEQPDDYDPATQDKGAGVGAFDADGWWVVTWPNVTNKSQTDLDAARVVEIKAALAALDLSAVRPLRAILAALQTGSVGAADTDVSHLADLESQAQTLRAELAGLEA